MKLLRPTASLLLRFAALLLATTAATFAGPFTVKVPAAAEAKPSAPAPAPARELPLVVVEGLHRYNGGAITPFDRLDLAFQEIAQTHRWPVKVVAERLAANTADHPTELRIFYKSLNEETPGELTLRVWVTLTVDGAKHDFGIVKFSYYPRYGEAYTDTMEKIYRGLATAAAVKIEPILFPKS